MKLRFFPYVAAAAILAVLSLPSGSEVSPKATSNAAAAPFAKLSTWRLGFVCDRENQSYCNHGEVTLTNSGNATLKITSIKISGGPFGEGNNCGTSLAPGKSCTIWVTFYYSHGSSKGFLTLLDNAGTTGFQAVYLLGYLL
jgi:hypothetical protein